MSLSCRLASPTLRGICSILPTLSPAWSRRRKHAPGSSRAVHEKRLADYRRVIDTLSGNGIAGNVLLSTGESFDVVRFGRLSAPAFYAPRTPEHGLTFLSDVVSAKWTADGVSVTERDGDQYTETGKGLTPGNTLVRLLPTDEPTAGRGAQS